ncbi:MAG TPA: sugar ABC transporter permease [Acidimicrobiia bacterium]|nr:sugar ABC transporter permease [Acidimicrobiia bacterium]
MTTVQEKETTGTGSARPRRSLHRTPWPVVILFLIPALALYCLFVLYPIAQSIRYSGYDWNGLEPLNQWVGLQNFIDAFTEPEFLEALSHNAIIVVLSLALQLPFALALAVMLNQQLKGRALLRTLYFAPYILSEVVTGVVWRQMLRPGGFLDTTLASAGGESVVREWLGDPEVVLYSLFFVISWKYFGFHMILLMAGLQTIPGELDEAAAIDGANWWDTFRYITLPLLGPTIRVSVFLSIIGSLQLFDLVWVTTRGGPINASSTMATYLVDSAFRRGQFGYASAVSVIVFVLSLIVALLYQRFVLRRDLEGALTGA